MFSGYIRWHHPHRFIVYVKKLKNIISEIMVISSSMKYLGKADG